MKFLHALKFGQKNTKAAKSMPASAAFAQDAAPPLTSGPDMGEKTPVKPSVITRAKTSKINGGRAKETKNQGVNGADHLPQNVQWLQFWTFCSLIFAGVVTLFGLTWYGLQQPQFALRGVAVEGINQRINLDALQSRVGAELHGGFFTLSVDKVAQVVAEDSWVRRVRVQREFPLYLRIQLEEQVPVAHWNSAVDGGLINPYGEVFEAQVDALTAVALPDDLPQLFGPQEKAVDVFNLYQGAAPLLRSIGFETKEVRLEEQGSWLVQSDTNVILQLGRGDVKEVLRRVANFEKTFISFQKKSGRSLQDIAQIDLRYPNGYAIAWRENSATSLPLSSILPDTQ